MLFEPGFVVGLFELGVGVVVDEPPLSVGVPLVGPGVDGVAVSTVELPVATQRRESGAAFEKSHFPD